MAKRGKKMTYEERREQSNQVVDSVLKVYGAEKISDLPIFDNVEFPLVKESTDKAETK